MVIPMASHNDNHSLDTTQTPLLSPLHHQENYEENDSSSGSNQDVDKIEINSGNNLNADRINNDENELEQHHVTFSSNIMRRMRRTSGANVDQVDSSRRTSRANSMNAHTSSQAELIMNSSTNSESIGSSGFRSSRYGVTPHMRDRHQRKLRYYFMSPVDKWRAKSRVPYKLGVQIIKMVLVTVQLMIFGFEMSRYLTHQGNMGVTFREIMLVNWDSVREVMTYPPAAGPYAIYTKDDFYKSLDHSIRTFANISDLTIGSFGYAIPINETLIKDKDNQHDYDYYQDYDQSENHVLEENVKNLAPDVIKITNESGINSSLNKTRDKVKSDEIKLNSTVNEAEDNTRRKSGSKIELNSSADGRLSEDSQEERMSIISICKSFYATGNVDPSRFIYKYDNSIITRCISIDNLFPPGDASWSNFSSLEYLSLPQNNFSINFDRLISIVITFPLRSIYLNSLDSSNAPECYNVNVSISYDNTQHDGQMLITLENKVQKHACDGNLNGQNDTSSLLTYRSILNWSVLSLCCISFILCLRSLARGLQLARETTVFWRKEFNRELSLGEKLEFLDLWILMIIINDILIISSCVFKIRQLNDELADKNYANGSILLGVGNLLVWAGLLRYLGFFHKYNILILTLKRAFPNCLRFLSCILLLYGGFCFAGWLVLGPHHLKFRTLSSSSECLFALLNGDDMFATFYITDYGDQIIIWWFSRIYLYLFISLFIYVVLSLFIAIIMDSYETVKEYYQNGVPISDLQKFISECSDESTSLFYMQDNDGSIATSIRNAFTSCFNSIRSACSRNTP